MSTGEAVVKRGRGRPKKVVEEVVEGAATEKTTTRKASTKAATSAKSEKKAEVAKAPKKTTATKTTKEASPKKTSKPESATTTTKKTSTKIAKPAIEPSIPKPSPVTPSTSKILKEVAATGTLKTSPTAPSSPTSTTPSSTPNNTVTAEPTTTAPKPITPPPLQSQPRATTIPLPSKPLNPASPRPLRHPTLRQAAPQEAPARPIPQVDDGKMPEKYKPAARRVTAIMVALPIVLVFGYELARRFRENTIRTTFETPASPAAIIPANASLPPTTPDSTTEKSI